MPVCAICCTSTWRWKRLLRAAVERQELSRFNRDRLVALVAPPCATWGSRRTRTNCGIAFAIGRLWWLGRDDGRDWALHAKSVTDRMGRWLQSSSDALFQRLQPKAEFLGEAFKVPRLGGAVV